MTEETLKIIRDRQEIKAKGNENRVRIPNAVFQGSSHRDRELL